VASDGATEDEARANLQEALLLYFDEPTADEPIPWWGVPASRS
jgi:predicted RNase H-like HicB family nuclease